MAAAVGAEVALESDRRMWYDRVGLRLVLAMFASIAVVEATFLVPSYYSYQRDLVGRLEHAGRAAVQAVFGSRGHESVRNLTIQARVMVAGSSEIAGVALHDVQGGLIAEIGEAPALSLDNALSARPPLGRTDDGRWLDVAWIASDVGLPVTVIGRLDAAWIGDELRAFVLRTLGFVLVLSIVVCGTTVMIFDAMVLAPVLRLRLRLLAARKTPTDARHLLLAEARTDEIGDLQRALDALVVSLAESIGELETTQHALRQAKDDLEKTVQARTRELRDSESRFRAVTDNSPNQIVLKDLSGRFLLVNRRFELDFAVAAEAIAGKTWLDLLPEPVATTLIALDDAVMSGRQTVMREIELPFADGSTRTLLSINYPVFDADGDMFAIGANLLDISDRKRAEETLRRAHDELEIRVEARTRELTREVAQRQQAEEAAARASRAKSDFLASMSHELRTPLNAVLGFAQLLQSYSEPPLTDEQNDYVEHILSGGRHLLSLINEVLDLSKIEAGKAELAIEAVGAAAAMRDSLSLVRSMAEARGIAIDDRSEAAAAVRVMADPKRFKQVLLNLLSNAVKYNSEGGVLTLEAETTAAGMVCVRVSDTGPGIPAEKCGEVFQPFRRLGAGATEVEGTGIGLSISRQLVEAMGGEMDFDSEVGAGSRFWFTLPLAEA